MHQMGTRAELDGLEEYGKLGGTVFAESEVVARIAEGRAIEDIAGIHVANVSSARYLCLQAGLPKRTEGDIIG
jgi:activator of 2-hydroxyglutaryl-CoA dehydratase